ncbi:large subunit ribosomal protein L18 [Noviherbaspirillum humi]|uniref:Large ribosomal subunit protein uL18 n=1 Tax=Noviherbaspirillum humi TaxID=1688639 RepID=A0A239JKL9_9BURK|nr:50S ribosomal protein L18 [Noviherbaspirillum humi]SNT05294.1 large subunit ribosomal protein L18 [Noviherbaspirillum humi]
MDKKQSRLRRARQTRAKIAELKVNRLAVHRTNLHIYANIIGPDSTVLASASTLEAEVRQQLAGQSGKGGNTAAAALVGKRVAEKALKAGIEQVAFDRSGFRYHGRVKAVADAAREAGLKF